ncbi:MAG: hypothetical protein U0T73_02560 [Chitinophagales bacterium]
MPEFELNLLPLLVDFQPRPTIVGWNRLEPRPRTDDFSRSLKAEVRDPLWMLCRQWQFGEFLGEDAGSPVDAKLVIEKTAIDTYAVVDGPSSPYDNSIPLETKVEREKMNYSLDVKLQAAVHFKKLMVKAGIAESVIQKVTALFPFSLLSGSAEENNIRSWNAAAQFYDHASRRTFDGSKVIAAFQDASLHGILSTDATITAAEKASVMAAASRLNDWFFRLYSQPASPSENSWKANALEYQFQLNATNHNSRIQLQSDQYADGTLDWYAFDINAAHPIAETPAPPAEVISFVPTPVQFGGMPNVRYWEMEDRNIDFGKIDANTTDLAAMQYAEFGLIYSNDWFVVPYEMQVGTIARTKGILVTDVFGQKSWVRHAGSKPTDNWQKWSMFNISGDSKINDDCLFLMPAMLKSWESEPLEKVSFIRDEMANMVWAIESVITTPDGKARSGYDTGQALTNYLGEVQPPAPEKAADLRYKLGTTVPRNWIPFLPVHPDSGNRSVVLQQAQMPSASALVAPRTVLLSETELSIHEEEVLRSGTVVTRAFQRTRWMNGKTYLWLGRKVLSGKGEGSSGLVFDTLQPA